MILKPSTDDIRSVVYYLGQIILGLSLTMLIPASLGFALRETGPCLDFVIGTALAFIFGASLTRLCATRREPNWMHGMVAVALAWLAAMALSAVPLVLSGHFRSYLDACFETISGFSTTGLSLVQDLDHLSYSHNLWRHLGPFIGGQGITIIALSLLIHSGAGAFKLYVGEARDEKLMPNVIHTSRTIWLISLAYLLVGTIILGIAGLTLGMSAGNAFFHGICLFMAGFDTAGFAPQSQSILYYHSMSYEIILMVFMIMGALNFNVHYQLWRGNFKEIFRNIETRALFASMSILLLVVGAGLNAARIYPSAVTFFRKGLFQLLSAHTTTGYMTVYARQFITDWGPLALIGLILAMGLGGCICSTAGGIKMLRLGFFYKALREDIKKLLLPESAVVVQKFHHIRDAFLSDAQARSALTISLLYILIYIVGGLVGMFCGYPFLESLFESTSAAANVGFSCGVTDASMPVALKVTYILQMWAGRLEFMAVFALAGFFIAFFRGKK